MSSQQERNEESERGRLSTKASQEVNGEQRQEIHNSPDAGNSNIQVGGLQGDRQGDVIDLHGDNEKLQTELEVKDTNPQKEDNHEKPNCPLLPSHPNEEQNEKDYDADDEASHPSRLQNSPYASSEKQKKQANNQVQPSHSSSQNQNLLDSHKDEEDQGQQTNLLNFGFTIEERMIIQKQKEPQEIEQNQKENIYIPNDQDPQEHDEDSVPAPFPSNSHEQHSPINKISQHSCQNHSYIVQVTDCPNVTNSLVKNNDIYGISQNNDIKPAEQQNEVKDQQNEQQSQKLQQVSHEVEEPQEDSPSLQKIISSLKDLLEMEEDDQIKFRVALSTFEDHIDPMFLRPRSQIGQAFLSDGELAIIYVSTMILKQPTPQLRQLLKKYMMASLSSKISINQEAFIRYKKTQQGINGHSLDAATSVSQLTERQSEDHYRYSQVGNASVQAQDGSGNKQKKRAFQTTHKMDIDDPDSRPIKRTVLLVNINQDASKHQSPKVGKATRKRETTAKSQKQQLIGSQTNQPKSKNIFAQSQSKGKKSARKAQIDYLEYNQHLGSKYTYATLINRRKSQKELIQIRVSERLLAKELKDEEAYEPKRESSKKKTRRSSKGKSQPRHLYSLRKSGKKVNYSENIDDNPDKKDKENDDDIQFLNIDYLKNHLKEINVNVSMMERDYQALTENDKKITQLLQEFERMEQQSQQLIDDGMLPPLSRFDDSYEPQEIEENTRSVDFEISQNPRAIQARRRQFKKQAEKYKIQETVIKRVINCDINGHGIYALLQFSPLSQLLHKAKYALTPITNLQYANRREIQKDVATAKQMVGEESENIAYVQLNSQILKMIQEEAQKQQEERVGQTI